ncbi:RNA recognition motif-containing protein RRM [Heterostelium album PN500]|uniref:RNA recognition motif-containing protein RRM n=1 Tax=Heterostelium pallidum (strain ATCC 26659 / Pp 5 / PN500) TaxID=670386 RepID=D3AXJ9_HETP5|nr:RNA recognition motif-containing protein RRM [Heterostelium album PN500]EFA86268.1 RNA recognition motif-containing protein RRM [Heterostelium album PN500]|eukprot:XP_020438373.1 RNA recognition motif-containing protein RRM [Heterostelium album PN500]
MDSKSNSIGLLFLVRYYTVLSQSPETLKNFYHDKSVFTRRQDNHTTSSVVGVDNIHNEVMNLGLGTQVSIQAVDCQPSLNGGLFITCTGIMRKDMENRSFFHSFFLEKSQTTESYYVLNDVLVYVGREQVENIPDEANAADDQHHIGSDSSVDLSEQIAVTSDVVDPSSASESFNQVVPITENDYVQSNGASEHSTTTTTTATTIDQETTAATAAAVIEQEKEKEKEKEEETTPSVAAAVSAGNAGTPNGVTKPASNVPAAATAAPSQAPTPSNTPKTYADILLSSGVTSAVTTPVVVAAAAAQQQPTVVPAQVASTITVAQPTSSNSKESHKEGCTLFVSFVNSKFLLESAQLKQVFSQFGNVSHVRVLTNYAFVEFEKPEFVQNVLAYIKSGRHLMIGDNQLKVEEKRAGANKFNNNNSNNNNNNNNNNSKHNNNNNNNNSNNSKRDSNKQQSPQQQDKHDKLNNKPKFQQRPSQGGAAPKQQGDANKPAPKKPANK